MQKMCWLSVGSNTSGVSHCSCSISMQMWVGSPLGSTVTYGEEGMAT